jgi:hypothetical protein
MPKAGFGPTITVSERSKLFMPQTARLPQPAFSGLLIKILCEIPIPAMDATWPTNHIFLSYIILMMFCAGYKL